MGASQLIHGYDNGGSQGRISHGPRAELSSLAVASGFLDAALRAWDDDRFHAKSQVKLAAAMLRDCANDWPADLPQPSVPPQRRCLAPWQARKVKEFIDASLETKIRPRDCAIRARLSTSYFAQAFRATFGITACHYIRRRRIERAQQLMLVTQQPLSQIALACGFADQAHCCRVFRDVVGLSPGVWRRQHQTLTVYE